MCPGPVLTCLSFPALVHQPERHHSQHQPNFRDDLYVCPTLLCSARLAHPAVIVFITVTSALRLSIYPPLPLLEKFLSALLRILALYFPSSEMANLCVQACPAENGFYIYSPSVVGDAVLLGAFALLIPIALYWIYRYRTYKFSFLLLASIILEVVGFSGRILLHYRRGASSHFLQSSLGTILGPSLLLLTMACALPRMLSMYDHGLFLLKQRTLELFLNCLAFAAVIVEIVGVVFMVYGRKVLSVSRFYCFRVSHNYSHSYSTKMVSIWPPLAFLFRSLPWCTYWACLYGSQLG